MSRYLVDRITGLPNVEVVTLAEVTGLEGRDGALEAVRWRRSGEEGGRSIRHLFLFIGADPNTDWLSGSGIALDDKRFVRTGRLPARSPAARDQPARRVRHRRRPIGLGETSRAAVGEGAQVVATLHVSLAESRPAVVV